MKIAASKPWPVPAARITVGAYNLGMKQTARRPRAVRGAAGRLAEAERLFVDFRELTRHTYRPFARTFTTFAEYERWRRAQTNPWYR